MIRSYIRLGTFGRLLLSLVTGWLALMATSSQAQTTLNVTNFGARGDAVQLWANTVSNSAVITVQSTNQLSSADVGKLILLFGAGPYTTPTNNQDLVAYISNVSDGTNVTLSLACGATSNNVFGIYGTVDTDPFQNCVNAAMGTNTVIQIPAGTYLLVSDMQVTNFTMTDEAYPVGAAVTISRGGITFSGAGMTNTVLLGCGAWKMQGSYVHRGRLFNCVGPVTNNPTAPLIFQNLTMDGGVIQGEQINTHYFPAHTTDGSGWDETHDAINVSGNPVWSLMVFQNCCITHWRGEMLKSTSSATNCFVAITNCIFADGNASALNLDFSHSTVGCVFSDLNLVEEFYQGYSVSPSTMANCVMTNILNTVIALNGAQTNAVNPSYTISGNQIHSINGKGIITLPAQNTVIVGNTFYGGGIEVGASGYQGSDCNRNITIIFNHFVNAKYVFDVGDTMVHNNGLVGGLVASNTADSTCAAFGFCSGNAYSTNVTFTGNTSLGGWFDQSLRGTQLGQFYLDTNSQYVPYIAGSSQLTNILSYSYGAVQTIQPTISNSIFALDDSMPSKIPPRALLQISNAGNCSVPVYSSVTMSGAPFVLTPGQAVTYWWAHTIWATNVPDPPAGFRIVQ